jgi:ABC-type multidrug transport system fused ATPase/permease subunit
MVGGIEMSTGERYELGVAIGRGTTTLDWLKHQNDALRRRNTEQRRELRRLNQSIVDKLHQIQVARSCVEFEREEAQRLAQELADARDVIRAFMTGELVVVQPGNLPG